MKADLEALYEIARKDIMAIADQYSTLSNQVNPVATEALDPDYQAAEGRLNVGGSSGLPSALRSGQGLQAIRQTAQSMLALSSMNSEATASALIAAVDQYAEDEDEIKQAFEDIEKDVDVASPSENNPPAFPPGYSGGIPKNSD